MSDHLDLRALHQRHEPDPEFRAALHRRLAQIISHDGSASPDPDGSAVEMIELMPAPLQTPRRRLRPASLVATAAAAAVVVIAAVTSRSNVPTVSNSGLGAGGPEFAAAIEASGVPTSPSADDVKRLLDGIHYKPDTGPTQISAAGNYVSLRTCRPNSDPPCSNGWAYVTGNVDGNVAVYRGLLGSAGPLDVHLLTDRHFVASENWRDAQAPSTAWLIDAVSGRAGALSWRDEPTTLNSPEQALVLCDETRHQMCFLPTVVDARDGTIQPLAVPDDAVSDLPVAQHGTGRIWVGTAPARGPLGLAYSDNGGATWTEVALPEQMGATSKAASLSHHNKLLEVAADGERVAVAFASERRNAYFSLSDDAGRSWTTASAFEHPVDGAHLYVLADGRLVLMWSRENPVQLLASTGRDWAALEVVNAPQVISNDDYPAKRFTVNRAGIAFSYTYTELCEAPRVCLPGADGEYVEVDRTSRFSTDLTNWWTIEGLDD